MRLGIAILVLFSMLGAGCAEQPERVQQPHEALYKGVVGGKQVELKLTVLPNRQIIQADGILVDATPLEGRFRLGGEVVFEATWWLDGVGRQVRLDSRAPSAAVPTRVDWLVRGLAPPLGIGWLKFAQNGALELAHGHPVPVELGSDGLSLVAQGEPSDHLASVRTSPEGSFRYDASPFPTVLESDYGWGRARLDRVDEGAMGPPWLVTEGMAAGVVARHGTLPRGSLAAGTDQAILGGRATPAQAFQWLLEHVAQARAALDDGCVARFDVGAAELQGHAALPALATTTQQFGFDIATAPGAKSWAVIWRESLTGGAEFSLDGSPEGNDSPYFAAVDCEGFSANANAPFHDVLGDVVTLSGWEDIRSAAAVTDPKGLFSPLPGAPGWSFQFTRPFGACLTSCPNQHLFVGFQDGLLGRYIGDPGDVAELDRRGWPRVHG